jgi:hypothetical protein
VALVSSSAMEFMAELWELPQEGAEQLRADVVEQAADKVDKLTSSPLLSGFLNKHASTFGSDLVKVLGIKVEKYKTEAALRSLLHGLCRQEATPILIRLVALAFGV